MAKKKLNIPGGIVYSTSSDFKVEENIDSAETLPKEAQLLKIILDKKHRAGKIVTIIYGFQITGEEIESLSKQLKAFCGSGGSVKDNEIIIQGDHRDKVLQWLLKNGYVKSKKI
ncbi:MAG: translation initiation factor [Ginsengibacter sp.]|jgi:translation initiation factor 1